MTRSHAWPCFTKLFTALVYHAALASEAVAYDDRRSEVLSERDFLAEVPIVLTASRLMQTASEAPAATTVITREMIEASGFVEIADVFRLVPGFYVGYYNGHSLSVNRSISDQGFSRMQVLVDGRSVYTPTFGGVEWTDLPLALEDIERIEVIRGPNMAAFGSNAFLGIINIMTRHAAEDHGTGRVAFSAGSPGFRKAVVRYGDDVAGADWRATAGYRTDEGFPGKSDHKHVRMIALRGDYRINPEDSIQIQIGHNEGRRGQGFPTHPLNPPHDSIVRSQFQQVRWQRTLDARNEVSFQAYHTGHLSQEYVTTLPFVQSGVPVASFDYGNAVKADRYDMEIQRSISFAKGWRAIVGAGTRTDAVNAPLYFNTQATQKTDIWRVFAHTEWKPNPDTSVNGGILVEDSDMIGTWSAPRLALNYRLDRSSTLRLSYTEALRSPLLIEERGNVRYEIPTSVGPYPVVVLRASGGLEPEKIRSTELGYVGDFSHLGLLLDMRVFEDKLSQMIQQVGTDVQNRGAATVTGIESQLRLQPSERHWLTISHAYVHARSRDPAYERASPSNIYSALWSYRAANRWQLSAGYYRVSAVDPFGHAGQVSPYRRLDLRVAKKIALGPVHGDVALVVQSVGGAYTEFRSDNRFERRAYLTIGFDL